jgi:hypothetical protein
MDAEQSALYPSRQRNESAMHDCRITSHRSSFIFRRSTTVHITVFLIARLLARAANQSPADAKSLVTGSTVNFPLPDIPLVFKSYIASARTGGTVNVPAVIARAR